MGGERGFDATLAALVVDACVLAVEREKRKKSMPIHNTAPTMTVSGFVRRKDRTGPMAPSHSLVVLNGFLVLMLYLHVSD